MEILSTQEIVALHMGMQQRDVCVVSFFLDNISVQDNLRKPPQYELRVSSY